MTVRRALAFLTILGGAAAPTPAAVAWFPVVGALIGAAVGGVWWAADQLWAPAVAAALAVTADVVLTGALHFDGLVDTADGLLPPMDRARRLEVMADPRAGAFGVVAAAIVVLLRWSALATMEPSVPVVVALWASSRMAMAVALPTLDYARTGGTAEAFRGAQVAGRAGGVGIVVVGLATAATAATGDVVGLNVAVVAGLVAATAVLLLARRRLGGYTGDVLGAAGLLAETAGLLVAAARW